MSEAAPAPTRVPGEPSGTVVSANSAASAGAATTDFGSPAHPTIPSSPSSPTSPPAEGTNPPPAERTLRLTSAGAVLGLASIACIVLAYAFGYPAFAAIGCSGLAILLCVIPLTARNAPVELNREVYPARVARGEAAVGLLTVRNQSATWGQRLSALERVGRREIPVRIGQLPPHAAVEVRYELPTTYRGVIDVGPLRWDRTDPLGLVRRRSALPGTAVLHVHPAVHRFPLGTAAQNAHGEQARTDLALEGSITFHTLREYVPGDDLRRIHWRASAHRGELMVRQNIDVTPPKATIVLITDAELYADPDDFEHAVDVAASAAVGAVRTGQAVSLWTTGGLRLSANGAPEEAMLFLDRLAAVNPVDGKSAGQSGDGLSGTLSRLEHAERGGVLIVVGGNPAARRDRRADPRRRTLRTGRADPDRRRRRPGRHRRYRTRRRRPHDHRRADCRRGLRPLGPVRPDRDPRRRAVTMVSTSSLRHDTAPRGTRILLVMPTAVLCTIAGLSFRGAFDLGDVLPVCVLATVAASGIVALAALAAGRRARGFELLALGAALVGWLTVLPAGSIWIAGWRGDDHQSVGSFLSVLRSAVTDGALRLLSTTSPARPTAVLLATAGTCLWWTAVWAAICAVRDTSPLAVLLPPTILLGLGTAASAGAGDPSTIATAAVFLVAAVLFVGVDQATRGHPADAVVIGSRSARSWASAVRTAPFFAAVTALTLLTASLAPHLPGLPQRRPWDPRTLIAPPQQIFDETDPLTQAVAWLKEDAASSLLTVTTSDSGQRLRWQVLDIYDGRHWSSSTEYRLAGKTLPAPAPLWAPVGPSAALTETVRIQALSSVFLPATGQVRAVSGTDVRVAGNLGMIATGDGNAAPASLTYRVDTKVPDFSDTARLRNAQPGSDPALQPYEQLPPQVPDDLASFAATTAVGSTPYDQMNALAAAVRGAFGYAPDSAAGQSLGRLSALVSYGKDPSKHVGAGADAFASLFAVAARQDGFPARLVVGFAPESAGSAGTYPVTNQDVRVWPEVYFAGVGWVPFYDAVPDGKGTGGDVNPVQQQPSTVPTSLTPSSSATQPAAPYTGPSARVNNPAPKHKTPLALIVLGLIGALLIVAVGVLVGVALVGRRRRLGVRRRDPDPRRRTQWAWLESLDALGIDARTTTTPLEMALSAGAPLGDEGAEPIRRLAGLAEIAAYAPQPPNAEQAEQAWRCADQIRVLSLRRTPRRVRVLRLLRPPSQTRRH